MIEVKYIDTIKLHSKQFGNREDAVQWVTHIVEQLGRQYIMLEITQSRNRVLLYGNKNGRILLEYFEPVKRAEKPVSGLLLDKMARGEEECFQLENSEIDCLPISKTVSKETALRVCLHFVENGTMPPGLEWRGNMEKFS